MLKYCIILLDRTSIPFCHADNPYTTAELIPLDTLRQAIFWCMKENLSIQFVYPRYELPSEYKAIIDSVEHVNIQHSDSADISVYEDFEILKDIPTESEAILLRTTFGELMANMPQLEKVLETGKHVSVVIKDLHKLKEDDFVTYKTFLDSLVSQIFQLYLGSKVPQLNFITDRIQLDNMNNCNAGYETVTLAPNGMFYLCPAFYYDNEQDNVGSLMDGISILNPQLFRLEYAPICRKCDSFQCRRCIWLNKKTTREVNTPGHEQCVVAHLERNSSRKLQLILKQQGFTNIGTDIKEIDYLDPFEIANKWK